MTTYSLALLIYRIAMPSGLLVLAFLCGATYRPLMNMAMKIIYGLSSMDEFNVLLGVALFLRGFMKMIVSFCIILLEITNNLSLLPEVIMLVLLVLKTIGDGFNGVVY
jgi:chloride channel 7